MYECMQKPHRCTAMFYVGEVCTSRLADASLVFFVKTVREREKDEKERERSERAA